MYLDQLEAQVEAYLATFTIPDDYQERILDYYESFRRSYDDVEARRARLEARLERLKELYGWGDMTRDRYVAEKEQVQRELKTMGAGSDKAQELGRLAKFLKDVRQAWIPASPDQKNRLARSLYETVWIEAGRIIAVEPLPELEPFFKLAGETSEELSHRLGKWRPRGGSRPAASERP